MKRPNILTEIKDQGRGFISKDEAIELLIYVTHLESKKSSDIDGISESALMNDAKLSSIQDALYATGKFTQDQCEELSEGIYEYIRDDGKDIISVHSH